MKKNERELIIIIVIVGMLIIIGLLILKNVKVYQEGEILENEIVENQQAEEYIHIFEDGTKLNRSDKLNEVKKVEGLEIGDIQLTYKKGMTVLLGNVKNTTNKDRGITVIEVTLYNKNNEKIDTIEGIISPVKAGETVQLNMGVSANYVDAYDFKVEIK